MVFFLIEEELRILFLFHPAFYIFLKAAAKTGQLNEGHEGVIDFPFVMISSVGGIFYIFLFIVYQGKSQGAIYLKGIHHHGAVT